MSSAAVTNRPNRMIRLFLLEADPVFRLGIRAGVELVPDMQIELETEVTLAALPQIQTVLPSSHPAGTEELATAPRDLVLLSLDAAPTPGGRGISMLLCRRLKAAYPWVPILLLGSQPDADLLTMARQAGVEGYFSKGKSLPELVAAIRQVAAGATYWDLEVRSMVQRETAPRSPQSSRYSPAQAGPLMNFRQRLRSSGVEQIDAAITLLEAQLQYPALTPLASLVLMGRRRELRTARWLVNRLLATPQDISSDTTPGPPAPPTPPVAATQPSWSTPLSVAMAQPPAPPSVAVASALTAADSTASLRSLRAALWDATASKLQSNLRNLTGKLLEIDILKTEKKRELLYIVLRQLEARLDELRFSQVSIDQLASKRTAILEDLWQATIQDFFGKYFTLPIADQPVEIVEILLADRAMIYQEILDKIPLLPEFLAHLLFQTPLTIDDLSFAVGTVEAMQRLEMILQHLILQIANAALQPLLNRFGDVVLIKQAFYDKQLLSSREIERFRNNLSWQYRFTKYFDEPTAIFESRYTLLVLNEVGISTASVYAPRNDELAQLAGLRLAVTLALETRDAIAPRLRSAVALLGSGVIYVLTEVIGRGIGLIGRGVIKGIGNALQDSEVNRSSRPR